MKMLWAGAVHSWSLNWLSIMVWRYRVKIYIQMKNEWRWMNEKYANALSWRSTQLKFELIFHNGLKIPSQNIYSNEKCMKMNEWKIWKRFELAQYTESLNWLSIMVWRYRVKISIQMKNEWRWMNEKYENDFSWHSTLYYSLNCFHNGLNPFLSGTLIPILVSDHIIILPSPWSGFGEGSQGGVGGQVPRNGDWSVCSKPPSK